MLHPSFHAIVCMRQPEQANVPSLEGYAPKFLLHISSCDMTALTVIICAIICCQACGHLVA